MQELVATGFAKTKTSIKKYINENSDSSMLAGIAMAEKKIADEFEKVDALFDRAEFFRMCDQEIN